VKKPAKTREELEAAIRVEAEDICEWPTDLAISVLPHEDTWKVVIASDGSPEDADLSDVITSIADRLRTHFDWLSLAALQNAKPFSCAIQHTSGTVLTP
jgi:hypothetical protein